MELQELSELVYNHPAIARTMVDMHRRYRNVRDKLSIATDTRRHAGPNSSSGAQALSMPHDEVRDFFYARQNYLDDLDTAAEGISAELGVERFSIRGTEEALAHELETIATLERRMIRIFERK